MWEGTMDVQSSARTSNQLWNGWKLSLFSNSPDHSTFFLYFLIWACPRHFWPISRLNIDAFWFVWNSLGLFSVWKQTREQEKATSLRLIVRFGPEQTDSARVYFAATIHHLKLVMRFGQASMSVMRVKSLPFLVAFCLLCVVFSFTSFVSLSDLFQLFFIPHVSSFPGSSFAYLALLLCSFSDCLNLPICVIYLFLRDLGFGSLWFLEPFNIFQYVYFA